MQFTRLFSRILLFEQVVKGRTRVRIQCKLVAWLYMICSTYISRHFVCTAQAHLLCIMHITYYTISSSSSKCRGISLLSIYEPLKCRCSSSKKEKKYIHIYINKYIYIGRRLFKPVKSKSILWSQLNWMTHQSIFLSLTSVMWPFN